MGKINDDLWIWAASEEREIISLKEEIDKKHSLADAPKTTLYHYTNANGFKGIIDSKSLWLTDINYLNDAGELRYAQNLIRDIIKGFSEDNKGHQLFFDKLDWLSDPFENSFDIYITCFCEEGELLSQWKSYGLYSIGFNTIKDLRVNPSTFRKEGDYHKATLLKVIYDRDKQIDTITDIINSLFKLYKHSLSKYDKWPEMIAQKYARVFANFIMRYVLCFKNEVFKEENEWRLIHVQENRNDGKIKFRPADEYLIPYIEGEIRTIDEEIFNEYHQKIAVMGVDDLKNYVEENGEFPIKEIIIGPDPHHEIAEASAKKFLIKNGFLECNLFSKSTNLRKGKAW